MNLKQLYRECIPLSIRQRIGQFRRNIFLYGKNVYCPFCKGSFRHFLPYGIPSRQNSQCPRCGSLERYRLLYLYLKAKTNFFSKNVHILEVGPINCFYRLAKSLPNIKYTSIDISSSIAMIKTDLTKLCFNDITFDFILCYHVLDDIEDDLLAMSEMFRVLKPNGLVFIQVPIDINRSLTLENALVPHQPDVRIYGLDFKNRLESIGFKVRIEHYVNELDAETVRKYGLKDRYEIYYTTCEDIYVCSKSI